MIIYPTLSFVSFNEERMCGIWLLSTLFSACMNLSLTIFAILQLRWMTHVSNMSHFEQFKKTILWITAFYIDIWRLKCVQSVHVFISHKFESRDLPKMCNCKCEPFIWHVSCHQVSLTELRSCMYRVIFTFNRLYVLKMSLNRCHQFKETGTMEHWEWKKSIFL